MMALSTCQACRIAAEHPIETEFDFNGTHYVLKRCQTCRTVYYDPLPVIDYTSHTAEPSYVRDYVEANVNIQNLVALGLGVVGNRRSGRLVDMGCGYGFAADAVRR